MKRHCWVSNSSENALIPLPSQQAPCDSGLKCIGPGRAREYLADKLCPQNAVLTLENVKVGPSFNREGKRRSKISRRCFRCFADYDFALQIERHGIVAGNDKASCSWMQCFELLFRGSKYCEKDLYQWKLQKFQHDPTRMEELQLRKRPRTPDPATDRFQTTLTARKREADSGVAPAAQRRRLKGPLEASQRARSYQTKLTSFWETARPLRSRATSPHFFIDDENLCNVTPPSRKQIPEARQYARQQDEPDPPNPTSD
ncbi:hypothetical protein DL764_007257 [Monosporascus ibericus]|uniref:Uncharacterized protein n=1 Tax=Monosporascus ibericus TaxID=155417 RepID=A0A4Q4T290_9PEZI|nr:hypothetical protein DL764_007257 [Monosporascus ibericus]